MGTLDTPTAARRGRLRQVRDGNPSSVPQAEMQLGSEVFCSLDGRPRAALARISKGRGLSEKEGGQKTRTAKERAREKGKEACGKRKTKREEKRGFCRMKEVVLHVYDVTNSGSEKTNNTILQINRIFKDRIGLGGIFHSAIQVPFFFSPSFVVLALLYLLAPLVYGDEEWSFGFCEQGSGVFSCPPSRNPMYTYRERIVLGETDCSIFDVNMMLRELSQAWPGQSYDLLAKNCNHFCDTFCERLGVPKLPVINGNAIMVVLVARMGWVNRFANAGDTAVVVAGNAAFRLRQAKQEIVTASKVAYRFMSGLASNPNSEGTPESPSNSNRGIPKFQGAWFKNLMSMGAKPSTSTPELLEESGVVPVPTRPQQHSEVATQLETK
ncbi:hypothetical protein ZIOFF_028676 [Zingiber officinale]|uniref:PPPDE domain-containing protein n=1 Tax=Zingiber officinale TaxID=94328 RepID=A0A8J5GNE2_ZINOF|nr:hypothetical protein ZIOFF_028676 [Zingiber officinale]